MGPDYWNLYDSVKVDWDTLPAEMEEWPKKYPEAFESEYDPASGLRSNTWGEGRKYIVTQ